MSCKSPLCMVSSTLVVIGGINWGLVGLGMLMGNEGYNVVNMLLGTWPMVEAVVYLLVGISAVMMVAGMMKHGCSTKK